MQVRIHRGTAEVIGNSIGFAIPDGLLVVVEVGPAALGEY